MTPEQAAAFIHAQSVSAYAEIEGMKATNIQRVDQGLSLAYDEGAFQGVPQRYGLHYNQLVEFFRSVNG